ncbi:protein ZGRF1-like, partial [Stylophora pistillata]|uniref:protein ZGRF1-like n=1 Tax=Stylophora pistillata TaxID=50429 RepID=UPI000C03D7AF
MSFFRSHSVSYYCECHLIRKQSDAGKGRFGAAKAKKWGRQKCDEATAAKRKLYLELSRRDHSSTYAKDDIWIISKTLSFNPDSTFIASSVYYGPS